VADDDLLDLDFTHFVPPPRAAEPAPVRVPVADLPPPVPALAPAAEPAPASKYPVITCPAELREAAELYAQGKDIEASRCLEAAIKRNAVTGEAALRIWLALFEVLQSLGRKQAFETLALAYARKFSLSPPAWSAPDGEVCDVAGGTGGLPGIALSGTLTAKVGEALKQAMKLAQGSTGVTLDLAQATDSDNDAATLLMRALTALRKAGKTCVFGHPLPLAKALNAKLLPGQRENESLWLLQIELYQQGFDKAAFEDAAVGYAVTFEVSPPSYVDGPDDTSHTPIRDTAPAPQASASSAPAFGRLSLHDELHGLAADDFAYLTTGTAIGSETSGAASAADADAANRVVAIDASGLVRIDAVSAGALATTLEVLNDQGRYVRLTGLTQLTAAYLAATAVARQAELVSRRT
jgi:anti-anti-sigma regulatory factor